MKTDPIVPSEEPTDRASTFDADAGESEEVHAAPQDEGPAPSGSLPPRHRREFLRILGTMTFLTAGLEKLGTTSVAQGTPACGFQPVDGGPAAKDRWCGTYSGSPFPQLNQDGDCGKPMSNTEYHQDNDCGKLTPPVLEAAADTDCTKPGHIDDDCGKSTSGGGHEDNDCPPSNSDSDCGISSPDGGAHSDQDCHAGYSHDNDCGKASASGGVQFDSDCGAAPPTHNGDSDCPRVQQTSGEGLSGDQDCAFSQFDSTCSANDHLLGPEDPNDPLPPT